jgi:predicted deacetylase
MKKGWKITLLTIFLILATILVVRANLPRQIDDVSPGIPCEKTYLKKSDILWIIPKFQGIPISNNSKWCQEIISMNKTLGMHGVQHYYNEFKENLTQEYLEEGIKEFENCFNQTPKMFKPPKLRINEKNKILVEKNGMEIKIYSNQFFHKVYHCNNSGTLSNKFHDIF